MRWRVIGLVSLGVNLGLLAWVTSYTRNASSSAAQGLTAATQNPGSLGRTNIIVRRQFFSWREVESDDYPTYIANLRAVACPEQTIRDIIIADVNSLYARKRATELLTPDQQWWRAEPDAAVLKAAQEKARSMDEERKGLLTRLLGPNWEGGDLVSLPRPSRPGVALDGPVLGPLSTETKQTLQEINARSQERMQSYIENRRQEGKAPDPAELARLRQQTRTELAGVLAPAQLEEFLLRYSQSANNLRYELGQLRFLNASPDEFRSVFRATDAIDQQIQALAGAADANSLSNLKSLQDQRENAVKQALGPRRYEEYRLLHDPLYRDAVASAQQAGTPEAVQSLYAINVAAALEQQSIQSNANYTAEQKNIAARSVELDQLKANAVATGQELPSEPPLPPSAPAKRTYTLRPGDTPAVISMIYGVPEAAVRAANPNIDFRRLRPGDAINIPRQAPAPIQAPRGIPLGP